ncbi:hypothetical protein [Streptomyces virginiae]|uniref:hypothetical protein n=1 Tax=Streptomyces virginiae TaxID=1961 RepID=UPI0036685DF9
MTNTNELRVLEEDMDADAITFTNNIEGVTYLFVRPGQSFGVAVEAILRVCPELTLPQVQDLVRTHCPSIIEMNQRLGTDQNLPRFEAAPAAGVVPPAQVKAEGAHRRRKAPRWARIAAVAAPALAGGVFLAQLLQPAGGKTSSAAPAPSLSREDQAAAGTYKDPEFKKIAEGGQLTCDPMGAYEAKCVDSDGQVMSSEASVGTSTAFTFSYGFEKVGFRIFPDDDGAKAWTAEESNRHLYANVIRHGRVVLWGTDQKRLADWERSLADTAFETQRARHTMMMTQAAPLKLPPLPLPDRLSFLAFGTLHATEETIQHAVAAEDMKAVQLLRAVQLVLGNAPTSRLGLVPSGPDDAVAAVVDEPVHETAVTPSGEAKVAVPQPTTRPTPKTVVTPPPATEPPTVKLPTPTPTPPTPTPTPTPEPEPEWVPTPESIPTPEPESRDGLLEPTPTPTPETDVHPKESHTPEPGADPGTAPAPPLGEEPEEDGLSLETLPPAWAV